MPVLANATGSAKRSVLFINTGNLWMMKGTYPFISRLKYIDVANGGNVVVVSSGKGMLFSFNRSPLQYFAGADLRFVRARGGRYRILLHVSTHCIHPSCPNTSKFFPIPALFGPLPAPIASSPVLVYSGLSASLKTTSHSHYSRHQIITSACALNFVC